VDTLAVSERRVVGTPAAVTFHPDGEVHRVVSPPVTHCGPDRTGTGTTVAPYGFGRLSCRLLPRAYDRTAGDRCSTTQGVMTPMSTFEAGGPWR